MKITDVRFIKSIVSPDQKPAKHLPEFAFVGRSNVGKSSLINSLVHRKKIAQVSNTPGKTRTINYFEINQSFYLVDLPGYGYAKASKTEIARWEKMITNYLVDNNDLKAIFLLTDSRIGPQNTDFMMIEFLENHQIRYFVIATKIDKLSGNELQKNLKQYYHPFIQDQHKLLLYSSKTNQGRIELLKTIQSLLI